jgi:predicted RNA-binding protein with TRAM domain
MSVKTMEEDRKEFRFTPKPVRLGDVTSLPIENITEKGDGVAKIDGYVIFIRGVSQEDVSKTIQFKILEIHRKFAVAEKV